MTLADLFSDEKRADRLTRSRNMISDLADGMSALANLGTTLGGAPSADPHPRRHDLYERSRQSSDRTDRNLYAAARIRSESSLGKLKASRDNRLTQTRIKQIEAQERRLAADDLRKEARAQKQLEESDARIAVQKARARKLTADATEHPERSRPRRSATASAKVTWIDPSTGERYTVERGTWDKSSHSLFDIVVETTRPVPDARGYPSAEEWRRHCRDTYGRHRDSRDAFIITNLPGNRRALDYLRRLGG